MKKIAPNIYAQENFLSEEECQIIINNVSDRLKSSTVSNKEGGRDLNNARTSSDAKFDEKAFPKLANKIRLFISEITQLPIENQEILHVLKYETGQQFATHHDCWLNKSKYTDYGGQREYSISLYLNEGFKGGETRFPLINLDVIPKTGMLVIWNNMINSVVNLMMMHSGQPVIEGTKWMMPIWIRENKFTGNI